MLCEPGDFGVWVLWMANVSGNDPENALGVFPECGSLARAMGGNVWRAWLRVSNIVGKLFLLMVTKQIVPVCCSSFSGFVLCLRLKMSFQCNGSFIRLQNDGIDAKAEGHFA